MEQKKFPKLRYVATIAINIPKEGTFLPGFRKVLDNFYGAKFDTKCTKWRGRNIYIPFKDDGCRLAARILASYPSEDTKISFHDVEPGFNEYFFGDRAICLFDRYPKKGRATTFSRDRFYQLSEEENSSLSQGSDIRAGFGNDTRSNKSKREMLVALFDEAETLYRYYQETHIPKVAKEAKIKLSAQAEARELLIEHFAVAGWVPKEEEHLISPGNRKRVIFLQAADLIFAIDVIPGTERRMTQEEIDDMNGTTEEKEEKDADENANEAANSS